MQRYELMVAINNENILLDTTNLDELQAGISLNYQIADISDISSKNSSYSLQITLPDTKVNRAAFEYIFDINSDSTFDATKKSQCWVLKDTVIQFQGYLQLTEIDYDRNTGNDIYQVNIYADNSTLYTNIGQQYLSDLNLGQYTHVYNETTVVNSWNNINCTNGYYYGLADYGGILNANILSGASSSSGFTYSLNIFDMYPAVYVYPILKQIFLQAGYDWISDFLDGPIFNNLVIPFSNASLVPSISSTLSYTSSFFVNNITYGYTLSNALFVSQPDGNIPCSQTASQVGWNSFDCDISGSNPNDYNPNGLYSGSPNFYFENNQTTQFGQRFRIDIDVVLGSGTNSTPWTATADDILIVIKRSMYADGTAVPDWSNFPTEDDVLPGGWPYCPISSGVGAFYSYFSLRNSDIPLYYIGSNLFEYIGTIYSDQLITNPIREGEQIRFFFIRYAYNSLAPVPTTYLTPFTTISSELNITQLVYGSTIGIEQNLPSNIKQVDFLNGIIKMFDLYLELDKYKPNTFRFEPRDQYFNKYQKIKDWTLKLDISQPITSQITSNTQARKNLFTYTQDKDYYNSVYESNTNTIFGQLEFDINNDFISDENDITPIFSPTPMTLLSGSNNIYLPVFYNSNNGNNGGFSGINIRILYANKLPITTDIFKFNGSTFSFYPYMSYCDDPLNPQYSLNFGQISAFYSSYNETSNNLFYNYYQNLMIELSDKNSRIVNAYFNLNSIDISQFYFSDLIFMRIDADENYYRVNKIIDYDPSLSVSTQVELLLANDYNIVPTTNNVAPKSKLSSGGTITVGNTSNATNIPIAGSIAIGGAAAYTTGVISSGRETSVYSPGLAIGNNIIIPAGLQDSHVIGNNIIASSSNSLIIGTNQTHLGTVTSVGTVVNIGDTINSNIGNTNGSISTNASGVQYRNITGDAGILYENITGDDYGIQYDNVYGASGGIIYNNITSTSSSGGIQYSNVNGTSYSIWIDNTNGQFQVDSNFSEFTGNVSFFGAVVFESNFAVDFISKVGFSADTLFFNRTFFSAPSYFTNNIIVGTLSNTLFNGPVTFNGTVSGINIGTNSNTFTDGITVNGTSSFSGGFVTFNDPTLFLDEIVVNGTISCSDNLQINGTSLFKNNVTIELGSLTVDDNSTFNSGISFPSVSGTTTLSSGVANISNGNITPTSNIFVQYQSGILPSIGIGSLSILTVPSQTASTAFTVMALNVTGTVNTTDNSNIQYWIIN